MSATIDTWTGRLGLLAGALVVAAWLATAGRPAAAPEPAASIRLGALVNGELELSPLGKPVLSGSGLRAGGRGESGTLRVRNQTPRSLSFALRTTAAQRELDRAAWIEVTHGRATLLRTTLAGSHAWSARTLRLASGESRALEVRVWIPADAPDGWQAARGETSVVLSSTGGQAHKLEGKLPSEERNR
jgi:hypothetical protein